MRNLIVYLELEWKRSLKVLGKSAVSLLVILCITIGGVFGISYVLFHFQIFEPIQVAVVIPDTEEESKVIARFLAGMESVRNICRFEYMEEKQVRTAVWEGKAQAAVILPEDFYQDIYEGNPAKVILLFPEEMDLDTAIFRELLEDGVSMIRTAEAGVFAAMDTGKVYETEMESYEIAEFISYKYIGNAFRRGELFQESIYSPVGNLELSEFYAATVLVVFLLMSGVNCGFLYKQESRAVEQRMYANGLGAVSQTTVKIVAMAGMLWILSVGCYLSGIGVQQMMEIRTMGIDGTVFWKMIPLCFGIASYFSLMYVLAGRGMQGNLLLLCGNVLMIFCSGTVVPSAYLPRVVGSIGKWLPLNLFHEYSAQMLFGSIEVKLVLWMIIWGGGGSRRNRGLNYMEKTWYILQLKAEMKRKTWWIIPAAMIAVALLVSQMRIPNGENVSVGLCLAEDPMAEAIAAGLSQRESVFEFIVFEKESELRKALETAEIDSGFLFSEEFEEKVKKGCSKELITFLRTPFSAKGTVAKETLYAVFLEKYGEEILLDGRKEIYEEDRKDLVPFLLERNAEYLKSEEFFRTEVEAIPVQETSDKEELTDIYPIQGIMGIFLFVLLWMTFGRRFEGNGRGICLALDRKRQKRFEYLGYLAAVTIPSVTGIGVVMAVGESRGVVIELFRMFLLVFIGALWVSIVGGWFRSSMALSAWVLAFVVIQLVLCPVLINISAYLPAVDYIKYLFPLGWYV